MEGQRAVAGQRSWCAAGLLGSRARLMPVLLVPARARHLPCLLSRRAGHVARAVRLAGAREDCGWRAHLQVAQARLRNPVLAAGHPKGCAGGCLPAACASALLLPACCSLGTPHLLQSLIWMELRHAVAQDIPSAHASNSAPLHTPTTRPQVTTTSAPPRTAACRCGSARHSSASHLMCRCAGCGVIAVWTWRIA